MSDFSLVTKQQHVGGTTWKLSCCVERRFVYARLILLDPKFENLRQPHLHYHNGQQKVCATSGLLQAACIQPCLLAARAPM